MAYLVDTNVISETVKLRPDAGVMGFLQDSHFFLPSLVFAELAYGTYALNPDSKAYARYVRFIENLKRQYQHLVIPLSLEMAELSGRLRAVKGASAVFCRFRHRRHCDVDGGDAGDAQYQRFCAIEYHIV